jgi:hypothetical protein
VRASLEMIASTSTELFRRAWRSASISVSVWGNCVHEGKHFEPVRRAGDVLGAAREAEDASLLYAREVSQGVRDPLNFPQHVRGEDITRACRDSDEDLMLQSEDALSLPGGCHIRMVLRKRRVLIDDYP